MPKRTSLLLALTLAGGCAGLKDILQTSDYTAQLCGDGVVPIACTSLGTVPVPAGGQAMLTLVVALAGPILEQHQLSDCLLTAYPASAERVITVTASAICKLRGQTVNETLTITLTPVSA
jgi:hypothetical protein